MKMLYCPYFTLKKKNVLTLYCFITLIDLFLGVMPVFFLGLTIYPIIWGHSTEPRVGARRFSWGTHTFMEAGDNGLKFYYLLKYTIY